MPNAVPFPRREKHKEMVMTPETLQATVLIVAIIYGCIIIWFDGYEAAKKKYQQNRHSRRDDKGRFVK